jgi:NADH ubiquinone oxidoreductase, 20 Kd subunit
MLDATLAGEGSFSRMPREGDQPVTIATWVDRLAPPAEAVVATGSSATWGGVPAAAGSRTGAMGVAASHCLRSRVGGGRHAAGFARSVPVAAGAGRAGAGLLAEGAVQAGDAVLMAHEVLSDMRRSSPRGGLR